MAERVEQAVVPQPATGERPARRGAGVAMLLSPILLVLVAASGIAAFAAFRLWQARVGDPLIWQDSLQYQQVGSHPITSPLLWAGDRPPLTPLVWKLSASASSFVMIQTVVSIGAWSLLAVVVGRLARARWAGLLGGAVVLGFAATRPITQWDRSVLSESLSLSATALLFATAILWARRPAVVRGAALGVAALVFAAARDTHIWVVALFALVLGGYAVWHGLRSRANVARRMMFVAGALTGVMVLTAAGSSASHRDVRNVQQALFARVFPYQDRIAWFADHGMPQADQVAALARAARPTPGTAPVVSIDLADPQLQPLAHWLRDDAPRVYVEWLALHPRFVFTEPFRRPERTYNNADGHLSYYAADDRTDAPLLTGVLYPGWAWVLAAALLAALAGKLTAAWRRREGQIVALLGALGGVHMLIAWHGDGMEVTRHASIGNVQLRLAVLIGLVMVLDSRARTQAALPARTTGMNDARSLWEGGSQPVVSISPRWPSWRR